MIMLKKSSQFGFSTNHKANREAELTVVIAHAIVPIAKVQAESVITTTRGRTPIVTVTAYIVLAAIAPTASSRK